MLDSIQESFPEWSGEVILAIVACFLLSRIINRKQSDIPVATGGIPILGHALAYKDDPATFLQSQPYSVFRINLAGRQMVVIGSDAVAMKQVASMSEEKMSARQAVADVGFEYTLGLLNVHKGTDCHKRILKDYVYNNTDKEKDVFVTIFQSLLQGFDKETPSSSTNIAQVDDLFIFMRRCILRAMLTYMIAPSILDGRNERFLDEFMQYQDAVEDATAKAAVLPRFLSIPLALQPVQKQRQELTLELAAMIDTTWNTADKEVGPWLTAFQKEGISSEEAAELTMGLLFAAHKNPAIGVSQCFCYLQTEATVEQQETALNEARTMYKSYCNGQRPPATESLRQCVLETLRLTAHSIGGIRTAQKDFVLETSNGQTYSIQKGNVIAISHISTHRDASVWGSDALAYRQDRWKQPMTEKNTSSSSGLPVDDYKYTTFSHGVHKCPGETIAVSMMEIVLAILLVRNAKLAVEKENLPKVSFERATLAQREGNVPITIDAVTTN